MNVQEGIIEYFGGNAKVGTCLDGGEVLVTRILGGRCLDVFLLGEGFLKLYTNPAECWVQRWWGGLGTQRCWGGGCLDLGQGWHTTHQSPISWSTTHRAVSQD